MKKSYLILMILFFNILLFGQKDKPKFFSELVVSVNRTDLENQNTENGNGFGIGIYQSFRDNKKVSLILGFEFNRTSQLKKSMYGGHFAYTTDVKYNFSWLSIPLTTRINFGGRIKFFIEPGIFVDIPIGAREKGTLHSYLPNEDNQIEYKETEYDKKASQIGLNYGLSFGLGIIIPVSKVNLIIKPDYRLGMKSIYDYQDQINNKYFRINIGIKI
ncbi:MAG: hypothetical protein H8E34_12370 [Bacteroidetes bacterium]|nr:hypothetical protein [Bacteroidota bacterium]MBL6943042.1 hypothetical protein [Bacteroidales bacterium]